MGVIFMALEELLAAEFAKITNDNEKTSEGSTVYGTCRKVDGKDYIELDGSDGVLTPISGSTTKYAEGDRVSGIIKNHSLTVTGNITQPGLTKADDIEDGTIKPIKLEEGSLEVGVNVKMGENTKISWGNLPSDVAKDSDIPYVPDKIVQYTEIDGSNVITQNLKALNLDLIGGSVNIDTTDHGLKWSTIKLSYGPIGYRSGYSKIGSDYIELYSYQSNYDSGAWVVIEPDQIRLGNGKTVMGTGPVSITSAGISAPWMSVKTLSVTETISGNISGNAATADKATTADRAMKVALYSGGDSCEYSVRSKVPYGTGDGVQLYSNKLSSSLRKFKKDIEPIHDDILDPNRLYDVEVVQFKYNDEFSLNDEDWRNDTLLAGFIVDDLEEIYPNCIRKDNEGNPRMWDADFIIPPMLKLIQDQKKQIDDLEARLAKLEAKIGD